MTLLTTSENTDTQRTDIQLTLSLPEAERLRITLPWLCTRSPTGPRQHHNSLNAVTRRTRPLNTC
jgi:hypothetical protein